MVQRAPNCRARGPWLGANWTICTEANLLVSSALKHQIRIDWLALPPAASGVEDEDGKVQVGSAGGSISGGADITDELAAGHGASSFETGRVPLEVGVVVAEPLPGIEFVHRVAAGSTVEQLRDGARLDGIHRSIARREDVHRLVRPSVRVASLLEHAFPPLHIRVIDGEAQVPACELVDGAGERWCGC